MKARLPAPQRGAGLLLYGMINPMNTRGILLVMVVFVALGGVAAFFLIPDAPKETPLPAPTATTTGSTAVEDDGQYYEITAEYPESVQLSEGASATARASAHAVVEAWVKETVATFKANSGVETLTPEDIRIQGLDQGRKYALHAQYTEHAGPATVSYLFEVYEDTLGAHPNAYQHAITFDAATGKELRLADVFESSSYLETLSKKSRALLIPQIAKVTEVKEDELDTSYLESGTTPIAENFQVFYFEGDDFVIVFPPYQVGPWVLGTQVIRIPRAELAAELKAAYR